MMGFIEGFLVGAVLGACLGLLMAGLCVAARKGEEAGERP